MARRRLTYRRSANHMQTLHEYLETFGPRVHLGKGSFGTAYTIRKGKEVLKVTKSGDTAYMTYVKWCVKNQRNPFVPKIFKAVIFQNRKSKSEIVVHMERLSDKPSMKIGAVIRYFISDDEDFAPVKHFNKQQMKHLCKMREALDRLRQYHNILYDFHEDNVMMRGKTQPVVIDPLYNC